MFVNNFAFGPSVDHKLKERFASMREGMYQQLLILKIFVWYFKCKKKIRFAIVINKPRETDQNISSLVSFRCQDHFVKSILFLKLQNDLT